MNAPTLWTPGDATRLCRRPLGDHLARGTAPAPLQAPAPRPALTSGSSFLIYTLLYTHPNREPGGQMGATFCIWAFKHCLRSLTSIKGAEITAILLAKSR